MLVLSRRIGETVHIGDNVTVTILGCRGGQVRLGVVAPKDVIVDRAEIRERRLAEAEHQETASTHG